MDIISVSDLQQIVKTKLEVEEEVEILDYGFEPCENVSGYLGHHTILKIIVRTPEIGKQTLTFFSKEQSKITSCAEFSEKSGAFRKEVFIYELFQQIKSAGFRLLDDCIPNCYLTKTNKILILENLSEEGYEQLNKHELSNYKTTLVIVKALAKMHACSIAFEEHQSLELAREYRLPNEPNAFFQETFFSDEDNFINKVGISAAIRGILGQLEIFHFPEFLKNGKNFRETLNDLCFNVYQLVKPSNKYRNVISHGDLWIANYLIKSENKYPKLCKFVDFQAARYVPPAQDVLAAMFLSTSRQFRKCHMYEILGIYHATLDKHLKFYRLDINSIVPFEEFMQSCEDYKQFAIIQAAVHLPIVLVKDDIIEKYFSNKELFQKAFYEDRTHLILDYIQQDETYKDRLYHSMLDLKDCCERV